jgi:hypothetical protein
MTKTKTKKEKYEVKGEELLAKVKELIKEGNIRRLTISDKKGEELASFPLTIGVIGVVLVPVLAAIGTIAALITECTLTVERKS